MWFQKCVVCSFERSCLQFATATFGPPLAAPLLYVPDPRQTDLLIASHQRLANGKRVKALFVDLALDQALS